jgi:hypothetical protein
MGTGYSTGYSFVHQLDSNFDPWKRKRREKKNNFNWIFIFSEGGGRWRARVSTSHFSPIDRPLVIIAHWPLLIM